MMKDEVPKRGRPPKGEDAKRYAVGIRTTRETKTMIEEAAAASGRSMAQEIEYRLERSFHQEADLGGRRSASLARFLGTHITTVEEMMGCRWFDNQTAWRVVRDSLPKLMHVYKPDPDQSVVDEAFARIIEEKAIARANERVIDGEFGKES